MAVKQETIVLGPLGEGSTQKSRIRTTSRGTKSRNTIEIEAEPLVHTFSDVAMGAEPAQAIRDVLEKQIKGISQTAAPSTLARRRRHARNTKTPSYRLRYTGGRTGEKAPNQTSRLFNDSGRLAEGVFVRQNSREGSFTVNVPANRLTEDHFAQRLAQLVPALRDVRTLLSDPDFVKAVDESIEMLIAKARSELAAKIVARRQAQIVALRAAFGLARAIAG